MLDPVREKCDLHIRAAGIFVMQLELLEIQRLVTLSHNEGPIVAEEAGFATVQRDEPWNVHRHSHVTFLGCLALCKGDGEGEGPNFQQLSVGTDPSPQSSPLQQGGEGNQAGELYSFLSWMSFPFAVVPKAELFTRTHSTGTAEDYAKEFGQKIFRRIHAQFPG